MPAPTNLATTQNITGNREDLEDAIYRVAPEKTPFVSTIGKNKATGRYHEWQTESLATPSTSNAAYEGDDVSALDAANNPARIGNYCQIFTKKFGVSRTQDVVAKAGRKSESTRQKVIKGIELRRDMEATFTANQASINETPGTTPRKTGGALAFIATNASRGASGASGGFSAGIVGAATNGTLRTFTEALLKASWAVAFTNGADPKIAMMGGTLKQEFSTFTGIAQTKTEVKGREQATIIGGADVYVGDFGQLMLVPHPYAFSRDVLAADPDYFSVATLDGFQVTDLAKTGDSRRQLMTHEAALECQNEKAHFVISDLQ